MSIQNAIDFIQIHVESPESRTALYKLNSFAEFSIWQTEHAIPFSWGEFEESVNLLHVKCQTYEEAEVLLHNVEWARMLFKSLTNP